jgi:hypothetical protein
MEVTEADLDAVFADKVDTDAPTEPFDRREELQRLAGERPLMMEPVVTTIELPKGLYHNGIRQKEVEVRELTGADEEILGRYGTKSVTDWFDTLLRVGVARIGPVRFEDLTPTEAMAYLDTLLTGERSMIYMAINTATFGQEKELSGSCQRCNERIVFVVDMVEDFKPEIPENCDQPTFSYTTKKGQQIEIRLLTGEDERELMKAPTVPEQKSIILERTIVQLNGHAVPDPRSLVRSLGLQDREGLLEVINQYQPKIDMDIELECPKCLTPNTFSIGFADLFRP